ncbi:MAG TPA: hypothetical protein VNN10_15060 [Dehalococcoidia bacterium]|nr:hypothetical protein [Dehalococcoidia bacterium]
MPKKPRQAHIPRAKVARKRKANRRDAVSVAADAFIDVSGPVQVPAYGREPVGPIPLAASGARAGHPPATARMSPARAAGQLPTFERAYLVEELRRIGVISASLLGVIVLLAIFLR